MSKTEKYCKHCKLFYGQIHYTDLSCPVGTCRKKLKKINRDMVRIIITLNTNGYPVIDASLESNEIFLIFDRKCKFRSDPKGFKMSGIKLTEGDAEEAAILFSYSEPDINKTPEELKIISDDIYEWIKTFCKVLF
jgi:hypothetical protein